MVSSNDDIIIYATILTLALDDTRHVGISFLEVPQMKLFFEHIPVIYTILVSFYKQCQYGVAYSLLQQYIFPKLQYDLFINTSCYSINLNNANMALSSTKTHLHVLQDMIRTKAIIYYWKSYQSCSLLTMMEGLGSGITGTNVIDL